MKNITFAIDDEDSGKGADRRRAQAHDGKRPRPRFLTEIAGREERQAEARKELLRLANESKGRMAPDWKFDREETHER